MNIETLPMVKALIAGLALLAIAAVVILPPGEKAQPAPAVAGALLAGLLQQDVAGFAPAKTHWRFRFPADHASHPDYRTESWHFSGNLSARDGRRFAFQLTFLRIGVNPPATPLGPSAWAARDVYWARLALTDASDDRLHAFERIARGAMGQSGAQHAPVRVWVEDWVMELQETDRADAGFALRAAQDSLGIELALRSAKPAVTRGAAETFHGYLITRLDAQGSLRIGQRDFDVAGDAWLDRAWGLVPLPLGAVVWDRFLLHLEDGRDLMGLRLRRRDGSGEPVVSGLLVERDGSARTLESGALTIDLLGDPPKPRWRLRVPAEALELDVEPYVARGQAPASMPLSSSAVRAGGTANGRSIQGQGHVELAGRAAP